MTDPLDSLRDDMDRVTIQMIRLLKERADISLRIGAIKGEKGLSASSDAREFVLRDRVLREAESLNLDSDVAARFLNHLTNESTNMQNGHTPTHLAIFKKAKELEQSGKDMIHMEVGQPDFAPPPRAGHALLEGFNKGYTKYDLSAGMPSLRKGIAEYASQRHTIHTSENNVIVTPGARFAVFAAITSLLKPGDEIIIPEPTWPAYKEAAIYCGAKPRTIHTTLEQNWDITIQDIQDMTTPQTKMIVLCYPSNPTGKMLSPDIMDQIMRYAKENDMYVLSDEIYAEYAKSKPKSVLEYEYDKGIVTQSFSKSHAMMGFRIGYAISSADIINKMSRVAALCLTNVPGVIQYAALKTLNHDTTRNTQTMRKRLNTMCDIAEDAGLEFMRPDGAMYVFGRAKGILGLDLVDKCLDRGLALAPGVGFGHYPEFVRISAGTDRITDGMNILCNVLREYEWKK